jgi:hypothetical protein
MTPLSRKEVCGMGAISGSRPLVKLQSLQPRGFTAGTAVMVSFSDRPALTDGIGLPLMMMGFPWLSSA